VLRGGAFNNDDRNVRCAYRNRNDPDNHNRNIGVRVVVRTLLESSEMPGAYRFRAEVRNGGACSGPRPRSGPGI
jgi:hypothetical protein